MEREWFFSLLTGVFSISEVPTELATPARCGVAFIGAMCTLGYCLSHSPSAVWSN